MGRNDNFRHITDNLIATFGASQPAIQITKDGFPAGDEGVLGVQLTYKGEFDTSAAAGAAVTDGALKILRALTVETDKHRKIIDGVDGLGLHRMLQLEGETRQISVDCASNADATTFEASLYIPFADDRRLIRPYDCLLDMKNSKMTVKRQYGVVTDIQSAGTAPQIVNMREDISVEVVPGPINDGSPEMNPDAVREGLDPKKFSELPGFIPVRERNPFPITATKNGFQIPVSVGDKILRRIYLSQQTIVPATGLVTEVSNIVSENAAISFKVGKDVIMDRMTWKELVGKNKRESGVETMPTGWAFISFDRQKSVPRMLDLYKFPSGLSCNVEVDVTTQTNANLVVYLDYLQLIPPAAVR